MNYQVLARKWRPQRFEEVIGQDTVTRTLQNAIKSERIAHAFLFSGVRGVGKTTTARILSRALNCQGGPTPSPCGECVSCREIAATNSVDVLEIDAASNTGVDNIRDLRESVRYGTSRDRFKIFIIDEVHMLSKQAFNALLKTLEEPPEHVKFILATTELNKIPDTIRSRCQHFKFKSIAFPLLLDRLKEISHEEGIEISDYALRTVVSIAEGSMRDAQSRLDQVIAFAGTQVSDDDVRTLLGVVDERLINAVLESIVERKKESLVRGVDDLRDSGVDPQNFCQRLLRHLRNLMVYKVTGWEGRLLNLPDSARETIANQAGHFSSLDLIRFYDVIHRSEGELNWHSHPYVHLEMTLMSLVELAQLPLVEEVITRLESGGNFQSTAVPTAQAHTGSLFDSAPQNPSSRPADRQPESLGSSKIDQEAQEATPPVMQSRDRAISDLLAAVQMESPRLYHSMQQAAQVFFRDGRLSLLFPEGESFHQEVVLAAENQERLARLCTKITGSAAQIEVGPIEIAETEIDPTQDPRVRDFVRTFPGQVVVEREGEE